MQAVLCDRKNEESAFWYHSFQMWMKRQKIPMSHFEGHFVLGDLRKFAEQHGDVIQWDQSNRAYVLTHGVSGVDWKHYKHPLPETVYDVYMKALAGCRSYNLIKSLRSKGSNWNKTCSEVSALSRQSYGISQHEIHKGTKRITKGS
jgi:hypothetical protein